MNKNIFINALTKLIQEDRKEECVILMKRIWIKISIKEARDLIKTAFKYNSTEGDLPFPKTIQGVAYKSSGEYIYLCLTEEQRQAVENCEFDNIEI